MSTSNEESSLPLELGGIAAGGAGIAAAPNKLLGRKTMYHGTSDANAKSIEQGGFIPSTGRGGASERVNSKEYMEQSKGKTHFTSVKPIASDFSNLMGRTDLERAQAELEAAAERFQESRNDPQLAEDVKKAEQHVESMHDVRKGKILKVNVPYHIYQQMESDPHIVGTKIPEEIGGRLLGATYTEPLDPKYIMNGEGGMTIAQRLAQSAEHFPEYIKHHPGRFASGVGLIGGGAGIAGVAGKRMYDRLVDDEHA